MSELLDHDQFPLCGKGNHIYPVDRLNDKEVMLAARSWGNFEIRTNLENTKISHLPAGELRPGLNFVSMNTIVFQLVSARASNSSIESSLLRRPSLLHQPKQ